MSLSVRKQPLKPLPFSTFRLNAIQIDEGLALWTQISKIPAAEIDGYAVYVSTRISSFLKPPQELSSLPKNVEIELLDQVLDWNRTGLHPDRCSPEDTAHENAEVPLITYLHLVPGIGVLRVSEPTRKNI